MYANAKLEARMEELSFSQAELAKLINLAIERLTGSPGSVTDADVRRWLRYETKWPQDRIRLCIEEVLDASSEALGFIPRRKKSGAPSEDGPVLRREFHSAAGGAILSLTVPQTMPRGRLGVADAQRFHQDYVTILRRDREVGGTRQVENLAIELALRVQSALASGTVSSRVRVMLHGLAADAMTSAAFAALDSRSPSRARSHLGQAMTFAGLSRSPEKTYRVWDHLMLTSSMGENHSEAAAGAEVMKRSTASRRDPLYASLGHMRNANALARLHHRQDALRAHGLAEKNFNRTSDEPRSDWISFYSRAEFDALSSYMWAALGDHYRAEYCLHRTLAALPDDLVRDKALFTAHLALTHARQGELELACSTGAKAYAMLPSGSKRTSNVLAKTREVVAASGSKVAEVVEWIEGSHQWI
ncbi:XRE family transcriptional regulator [Streptomyces sp. NPDC047024]|uniref:XRE family transcriptional regulator n=1 Tax=Streptomyces sp. NPDC047024 TaxID=3155476 RepID=UPI0033FA866E